MGFAINPSLNHIDIPESLIYEFYRSSAGILLQDARFRGHPCEAYICIAKVDKALKAYVALLETGMKTVFVYTSDYSASDPADYPEVYRQAEAFVKVMGFVMEPVNLAFSPAMREVIIKGFRVMRPPPPKKQPLRQPKTVPLAEPRQIGQKPALPPVSPPLPAKQGDQSIELEILRRELVAAQKTIEQITREKQLLKQKAIQEITALKNSYEQAVEEKQKAAETFAAEAAKLKLEESSRVNRREAAEKSALKADLKAATEAVKAAENRLRQETTALQKRVERLASDKQSLTQQLDAARDAAAEQFRQLTEEKETLLGRIAAAETAAIAAEDKITALALFETSWREGQQREEDLCRNIDLMTDQLNKLTAELEPYKEREGREEALQLTVNRLEEELAATKSEMERIGSKPIIPENFADELKQLQTEKLAVETEYVRFANERREKELEMLDAIAAAEMEVDRLSRELEIQARIAAREQAVLQAELRQMVVSDADAVNEVALFTATGGGWQTLSPSPAVAAAAGGPAEEAAAPEQPAGTTPPPVLPPVPSATVPDEPLPLEAADDDPDMPIVPDQEILSGLMNEFGSIGMSSSYGSTEFRIDPDLSAVTYSFPAEIAVLLYSSNTVQAVPDSSSIQRCKGYVIATKKEGAYEVYIAWYLTESKKVVVCTPPQQPAGSEECIRILQDAVAYFEIIGFMMELAEMGETVGSYNQALAKIPALRRTAAN